MKARTKALAATTCALAAALALCLSAEAQQRGTLSYSCNIEGMQGQLVAQYEVIGASGVVQGSGGQVSGVIPTGDYTVYYQGQLATPVAQYVFTGENAYADFMDAQTGVSFRVQFIQQGSQLILNVNPFGPGPVQYACQLTGAQ